MSIDRLSSAVIEVEILPTLGARLHRIRVRGVDVLRTPAEAHLHASETFFWGAYNMAPWCNRIDAGPVRVGGQTVDLAANFRDGTAIHGQVYERPWETRGEGSYAVEGGDDGWPWPYQAVFRVRVEEATLWMTQEIRNLADEPMPAGVGIHPWFQGSPLIAIHAGGFYPTNSDSPPLAEPVHGAADLRTAGEMVRGLDGTWSDVGDPAVELLWPDLGLRATMRSDAETLHVTAASPTDIDAIAIEPQTHAPQGLRRLLNGEPGALAMLDPGAALKQTIEIRFETYGG